MPIYSRGDVLLVRYPFTDLSGVKVRPAVVVHAPHPSQDSFVVPLTSRLTALQPGEFALADWEKAGLNVPTAVKRGTSHDPPQPDRQIYRSFVCAGFSKFGEITARMVGALIVTNFFVPRFPS